MKKNLVIASSIVTSLLALALFITFGPTRPTEASVQIANDYQSTSTRSLPAGTVLTNFTVLATGPSTLGSIVITGAGAGAINIYDATTTNVLARTGNVATSSLTLVTVPVSAAAGTYTFDLRAYNGILVELTGTAPTSTITYRQ